MEAVPGWYGKLPSTGDFASRRLPHEIIEPWDTWLAEEISRLREQSEGWLNAYLESPTWRFVVPARWVNPAQSGWLAGILMPSVDSVGRYFPLSIMVALPNAPSHTETLALLLNWLHALDDLAADALQEDWSIDTLEEALAQRPVPDMSQESQQLQQLSALLRNDVQMVSLPMPDTRQAMMGDVGQIALQWMMAGQGRDTVQALGWWWCEPNAMVQARQMLVSKDLPRGLDFATLLGTNHDRFVTPAVLAPMPTTNDETIAPPSPPLEAAADEPVTPESTDPELLEDTLPPASASTPAPSDETIPGVLAEPATSDDSELTLPPVSDAKEDPDKTRPLGSDTTPSS